MPWPAQSAGFWAECEDLRAGSCVCRGGSEVWRSRSEAIREGSGSGRICFRTEHVRNRPPVRNPLCHSLLRQLTDSAPIRIPRFSADPSRGPGFCGQRVDLSPRISFNDLVPTLRRVFDFAVKGPSISCFKMFLSFSRYNCGSKQIREDHLCKK